MSTSPTSLTSVHERAAARNLASTGNATPSGSTSTAQARHGSIAAHRASRSRLSPSGRGGDIDVLGEDRRALQPGGDPADHHERDAVIAEARSSRRGRTQPRCRAPLSSSRRAPAPRRRNSSSRSAGDRPSERRIEREVVTSDVVTALEDQLVTESTRQFHNRVVAGLDLDLAPSDRSPRPGWPERRPSSACDRPARGGPG